MPRTDHLDRHLPSAGPAGRLAIYGATDRFNYGDLLFPLVIRWAALRHDGEHEPLNIAIRDSDLSAQGGLPTISMQRALASGELAGCRRLVVAGGQVLDARWTAILGYLRGRHTDLAMRVVRKLAGEGTTDTLARHLAGVPWPQPFVVPARALPTELQIAYNGVGGAEIDALRPSYRAALRESLQHARHVSVRDLTTQQALLRLGIEAELSPDSAVVMSRAFERDGIEQQMRVSLRERLQLMSAGGYLAFQIGQPFLRGREKRIAATLTAIAHATGLQIVLLAIGTATGHADQLALARVRAELPDGGRDVLLLADGNVWEIMGTIAGASLYIGTSLHGAITAMSFAVPRLAFTGEVRKLREYLQTWDLPAYASALPIDGAPALVAAALSVGRAEREQLAEQLIERAERGLHAAIGTPRAADLHHTLLEAAA